VAQLSIAIYNMPKKTCRGGQDNSVLQNASEELPDFSARQVYIGSSPMGPIFS